MTYTDPLHFPQQHRNWIRFHMYGGLLLLTSILVVPGLVVLGYGLRVIRAGLHGENEPPPLDDWVELLREGGRAWLVCLVYLSVPVTIDIVNEFVRGTLGSVLSLLWLVSVIAAGYVLPMALTRLALTGSMKSAIDVSTLMEGLRTEEYFRGWILVAALWAILGLALYGIGLTGFIPFLLPGYFYLYVAFMYAFGTLYRRLSEEQLISQADLSRIPEGDSNVN